MNSNPTISRPKGLPVSRCLPSPLRSSSDWANTRRPLTRPSAKPSARALAKSQCAGLIQQKKRFYGSSFGVSPLTMGPMANFPSSLKHPAILTKMSLQQISLRLPCGNHPPRSCSWSQNKKTPSTRSGNNPSDLKWLHAKISAHFPLSQTLSVKRNTRTASEPIPHENQNHFFDENKSGQNQQLPFNQRPEAEGRNIIAQADEARGGLGRQPITQSPSRAIDPSNTKPIINTNHLGGR